MQPGTCEDALLEWKAGLVNISVTELLLDQRWAPLHFWKQIHWLPVRESMESVNQRYGEEDVSLSLTFLQKAALAIWKVVEIYPAQLFFQMSLRVADSDLSPFLSAYVGEISKMSVGDTRCWLTARPVSWIVPRGMLRGIINVSGIMKGYINTVCMIPNSVQFVFGSSKGEILTVDVKSGGKISKWRAHSKKSKASRSEQRWESYNVMLEWEGATFVGRKNK